MRIVPHNPFAFRSCWLVVACALFALAVSGCAPAGTQAELPQGSSGASGPAEVEELPSQPEYNLPDPAGRGKVHVRVPEGYACSEYMEDIEPYTGKKTELEAALVDLGDAGSLQILVDDAGFLDWWFSGSMYGTSTVAEYVDAANEAYSSSWPISVDGHDGIVLIQGSADQGGEMSGQAFVFLDEATISFSAVLPDGETTSDAYSAFFRSQEVAGLFDQLEISSE